MVCGGTHNDTICGCTGRDEIRGGLGADTIAGDDGNARLCRNAGADVITDSHYGSGRGVRAYGGAGNDLIIGTYQEEVLRVAPAPTSS